MRRFYVEEIREKNGVFSIPGAEAKHITRVLRMKQGDRFVLIDRKGERFCATIKSANSQEVLITLGESLPRPPSPPVDIILCQSLLRSRPMDYMIQKTSELGVHSIFPFFSERTIVRLDKAKYANRLRHWRGIAYSATKQSDRLAPARISSPLSFHDMLGQWKQEDGLKFILWEEEKARDLKGLFKGSPFKKKIIGIIGPEGGFSIEEAEIARQAGFTTVSMGYRVLRAETAAITLVAIVQYELGDLGINFPV